MGQTMTAHIKSLLKQFLLTFGRIEIGYGGTYQKTQGRGKHQMKEITVLLYMSKNQSGYTQNE